MQPGDVEATFSDTTLLESYIGFKPKTKIKDGIKKLEENFRYVILHQLNLSDFFKEILKYTKKLMINLICGNCWKCLTSLLNNNFHL